MLWEGRALRDIRDNDVRTIIASGLQEHLQFEYKSELYADDHRGRREFLQDIVMFANTAGGILLLGVSEMRDERQQPTGVPDGAGVLGIEIDNPEAVLGSYDARVMEAVEERLDLESAAISVGDGRYVLAIRVPNSSRKPHSIRHDGHIYFTARRERQRYQLNVREIKELVMRTASRLEQAREMLTNSFLGVPRQTELPCLIAGIMPVFFDDFLIDIRQANVRAAITNFSRTSQRGYQEPTFTFEGLQRREDAFDHTVTLRRNGLLNASSQLPVNMGQQRIGNQVCNIATIEYLLRNFKMRAAAVYDGAGIGPPFVLGMMLRTQAPLGAMYQEGPAGFNITTEPIPAKDYHFPFVQIEGLLTDEAIRPLCDQAYQLFGHQASPNFSLEGTWIGRAVG